MRTEAELRNGVPLFLRQLIVRRATIDSNAMDESATLHGGEMLAMGFTVSQVIHSYGDICQVVTQLADETNAPISAGEFHTFNRCLDDVIADAQILSAAISNLLQNAFKLSHAHGRITLRTTATADRVRIEVEHECGGRPPGKAEDLFLPFSQRNGLGLGLGISRKGVEAMGGTLGVRDPPGQGVRVLHRAAEDASGVS